MSEDKETQAQSRNYVEDKQDIRYNKKRNYNEVETQFMILENGSAPIGDLKKFSDLANIIFTKKQKSDVLNFPWNNTKIRKECHLMKTTSEQTTKLMKLLIMMGLQKQEIMEISAAMETQEELHLFLNKLSEKNYEVTPEEVYRLSGETVTELM